MGVFFISGSLTSLKTQNILYDDIQRFRITPFRFDIVFTHLKWLYILMIYPRTVANGG
ncbi:MAG: hypothetical protein IJV35_01815 [Neisseriaceae bacterium]|nr:hypothetical protein [Neisseriaceae bacterium]